MTAVTEFIDAMRAKYSPFLGGGTPGGAPPIASPLGESPSGPDTSRFTGLGGDGRLQRDQPAGVVHEGEQVIESEAVEDAGGPGAVRDAVDGLIAENGGKEALARSKSRARFSPDGGGDTFNPVQEGFRGGTGRKTVGYQQGTGRATTPTAFDPNLPEATETPKSGPSVTAIPARGTTFPGAGVPAVQKAGGVAQTIDTPIVPSVERAGSVVERTALPTGDVSKATQQVQRFQLPVQPEDRDAGAVTRDTALDVGITGIGRTARGESEAAALSARQARQRLEGSQAAQAGAQAQALAQAEVEGGQALAEQARLQREQGLQTAGLESQIAIAGAERAEAAQERLAQIGLEQERVGLEKERIGIEEKRVGIEKGQLDEIIRKNKAGEQLSDRELGIQRDQLNEIIRKNKAGEGLTQQQINIQKQAQDTIDKKINTDIALTEQEISIRGDKFNMEKNRIIADTLIKNGQFGLAEQVMNDMGMKVLGSVKTADGRELPIRFNFSESAKDFFDEKMYTALGNTVEIINNTEQATGISDATSTADAWSAINKPGSSQLKNELQRAWEAMVVDKDGKVPPGQEWGSADSQEWAKDNIVSTKLQNDQFYQASDNLSRGTMEAILASTDQNLADFEFAGRKGEDGFKLAWTNVMATGGIQVDESGNIKVDPDNPALGAIGIKSVEEATGATKLAKAETPTDRLDVFIEGLTGKEGKDPEFSFSDIKGKDLTAIHENPAQAAKLRDAGMFDFNIKDQKSLTFDTTEAGKVRNFFNDLGVEQHKGGFKDPGSRKYDTAFVSSPDQIGPKILIGGTFYELRGYEDHEFTKKLGTDSWRRGALFAYKIDENGNRIGDKVIKLKSDTRDI